MLCLSPNNSSLYRICSTSYRYMDHEIFRNNNYTDTGYVRSKEIGCALLPLAMHDIPIRQSTYALSTTRSNTYEEWFDEYKAAIDADFNSLPEDTFHLCRFYTPTSRFEDVVNNINKDIFSDPVTAVQELYNKCQEQVKARQEITCGTRTIIKISKAKHMVLLISEYSDNVQASDTFLTIGLLPVLFPDFKEKFISEEIDYFKCLVNRSQVKRISNVLAGQLFDDMCNSEYYKTYVKEATFNSTINTIIESRLNTQRYIINESNTKASELLRRYQAVLADYNRAAELLAKAEETKDELKEEMKLALKLEGVDAVNYVSGSGEGAIEITFKVPVTFYDTDEAECALNNMTGIMKQLVTDVFIDQKYTLWLASKFVFSFAQMPSYNEPIRMGYSSYNSIGAMFNPHIHFFSCLGDYKPQVINAQSKHDLLMFNNLLLASTKSINFKDGVVMGRWKEAVNNCCRDYNSNYDAMMFAETKCLQTEDGKFYSLKDIYITKVLEQQEPETIEVVEA